MERNGVIRLGSIGKARSRKVRPGTEWMRREGQDWSGPAGTRRGAECIGLLLKGDYGPGRVLP